MLVVQAHNSQREAFRKHGGHQNVLWLPLVATAERNWHDGGRRSHCSCHSQYWTTLIHLRKATSLASISVQLVEGMTLLSTKTRAATTAGMIHPLLIALKFATP
jgi:hypothetical protein